MTIFEAWGSVICKARKVSQSTGDIHALRDIEVAFQLTGYAHDIQIFYASGRSSIVLQDCAFLRSSCRHVWQDFAETLFMIRTHIFDDFFWNDPAEIRSGYRAFLIGLAEVRHAATTKNGPVDPSSILCYAAVTEEALFPADKTEYASFLAHLCASAYTGCEVHKSNDSCCFHLFDPFCPWYCLVNLAQACASGILLSIASSWGTFPKQILSRWLAAGQRGQGQISCSELDIAWPMVYIFHWPIILAEWPTYAIFFSQCTFHDILFKHFGVLWFWWLWCQGIVMAKKREERSGDSEISPTMQFP